MIILDLLIKGINEIDNEPIIIVKGLITTPQLHFEVYRINNNIKKNYYEYYFNNLKLNENIIIDCSNGVGYYAIKKLINNNNNLSNLIKLINTNTED